MPYIKKWDRERLKSTAEKINTPGELNYVITNEILTYIKRQGKSYETINAVIGVLEAAKLEMYRRFVAPYEDEKRVENGDVYF
jgi:hypothetical protein